ncbi:MAG: hypothetical protein IJL92_06360 [Thermoguttaceae bacterium]|nr:hypothetical protein [Thermoguttaceae bacterium]
MDDDLFDDSPFSERSFSRYYQNDDPFGSSHDEGDSLPLPITTSFFSEFREERSDEERFGVLDIVGDSNIDVQLDRSSFFREHRNSLIVATATALIAIAGAIFAFAVRPFTIDVVASVDNPNGIAKLRVGSLVVYGDCVVGKVSKIGRNDFNVDYARLKIARSAIPRRDCKFRLEETNQGVGVKIDGGTQNAPPLSRGTTVVLSERKSLSNVIDRVKGVFQKKTKSLVPAGDNDSESSSFPWRTLGGLVSVIPWRTLGSLVSLGAIGFFFRKTIKIVAVIGALIIGGYFVWHLAPSAFRAFFDHAFSAILGGA